MEKPSSLSLCSGLTLLQESPVTESNDIKKVTEEDIEIDLEFNSKLFLYIIDKMQLLKNH